MVRSARPMECLDRPDTVRPGPEAGPVDADGVPTPAATAPVEGASGDHGPELSKRAVIGIVARHCGPRLIEATIIPAVLFYVCLVGIGLGAAYAAALIWTYGALALRLVRKQTVPGILMLGLGAITLRTAVAVASDSAFVYFVQPILAAAGIGLLLVASIVAGRPFIAKIACEFWPIPPDAMGRPGLRRLFRNLTWVWAAVNLLSAALTLALLVTLPLAMFVVLRQVSTLSITAVGVLLTVSLSLRTARREGLAHAPLRLAVAV